jgi:hypothetical protein
MQLENTHSGFAGKSLVNVMQDSLDKTMDDFKGDRNKQRFETDPEQIENLRDHANQLQGMVAGIAKCLGIIRGTSVTEEIRLSRERISERSRSNIELIGLGE